MTKSIFAPKRRTKRDKRMEFGVTRKTVWRDGKREYIYVGPDGVERESWFSACVGGLVDPGPTK